MHSTGKMRIGVNNVLRAHPKKHSLVHSVRKCSRAHPDGVADLLWVEVVVDEPVDDRRDLGLDQRLADRLWHNG